MTDLPRPAMTGGTDSQRIDEMRRYLYRLADQLVFEFNKPEAEKMITIGSTQLTEAKLIDLLKLVDKG